MLSLPGHRVEQFWAKVDKNGPIPKDRPELGRCWEWTGTRGTRGYGRFEVLTASGTKTKRHRRLLQAHKVAYELLVAPVPDGLVTDHLCRNRGCVNPAHLEPVTNRVNILRGIAPSALAAQRTHCPAQHEYTPENTYVKPTGDRVCRECIRINGKARWDRLNLEGRKCIGCGHALTSHRSGFCRAHSKRNGRCPCEMSIPGAVEH